MRPQNNSYIFTIMILKDKNIKSTPYLFLVIRWDDSISASIAVSVHGAVRVYEVSVSLRCFQQNLLPVLNQ